MSAVALSAPIMVHMVLHGPKHLAGTNCEQTFTLPVSASSVHKLPNGLSFAGGQVGLNRTRSSTPAQLLQHLHNRDPTVVGVAVLQKENTPESDYRVPIMLHRKGEECAVELIAKCASGPWTQKTLWTAVIPYTVQKLDDAKLASTWHPQGLHPLIPFSQFAQEQVRYEGEEITMNFQGSNDASDIMVNMVVQKAVNAASGEPITFYGNRQWALRKFGIMAPLQRFMPA